MSYTKSYEKNDNEESLTVIEQQYPLAIKIKKEQEDYIKEKSNNYLDTIKKNEISNDKKLEITTFIKNKWSLDIDKLYSVADRTVDEYQDISKDELSIVLLQLIASTNKHKLMRKVANKLIKKVGKR